MGRVCERIVYCKDENRGEAAMSEMENEVYTISSEKIEALIKDLPKGRPALMTTLPQNCYNAWGNRYRDYDKFD